VIPGLWWYPATVDQSAYRDGDTLNGVHVDLGLYTWRGPIRVRFDGIDAPERNTEDGKAATEFLDAQLSATGYRIVLHCRSGAPDETFGRYVARVFTPDGVDLCALMLDSGHAVPYRK
jgi:endonuclease YncB( thermonuclease family)